MQEVLEYIQENDVKFIRLAFCDLFGRVKNISIMPSELERAFESGIPFDATSIDGFADDEDGDLYLIPDPNTLTVLPWRPSHGRVVRMLCRICHSDGTAYENDSRAILKNAVREAMKLGYSCRIGTECEFYLLKMDENENPTLTPCDQGGYCDVAPLDHGENIRREICLSLEEMGIVPESSHHERGPGQNEIDFHYSDALTAADNLIAFQSAVKSIAAIHGVYASFLPKPFLDQVGSGMHVNLSLIQNGTNLFADPEASHTLHENAANFMAGILEKIPEITAFLNPLVNSYTRFGGFEVPQYIGWSKKHRLQLIRVPSVSGSFDRMELRSPDCACNPYLAFALLISAGMQGIQKQTKLIPEIDEKLNDPAEKDKLSRLPTNLSDALALAEQSELVQSVLPQNLLRKYCAQKRSEIDRCAAEKDSHKAELALYFAHI